ncbi:MAG: PAS domain-containing protein, partial [Spirulinaceae cyanobacterium]
MALCQTGLLGGLVGLGLGWFTQGGHWRRRSPAALSVDRESPAQNSPVQNPFEFAPIGMAELALDGTILQVNPALCRLLETAAATLVQTPFSDWIHPQDHALFQQQLQQLRASKTP